MDSESFHKTCAKFLVSGIVFGGMIVLACCLDSSDRQNDVLMSS